MSFYEWSFFVHLAAPTYGVKLAHPEQSGVVAHGILTRVFGPECSGCMSTSSIQIFKNSGQEFRLIFQSYKDCRFHLHPGTCGNCFNYP
jgi:hypothetical protein